MYMYICTCCTNIHPLLPNSFDFAIDLGYDDVIEKDRNYDIPYCIAGNGAKFRGLASQPPEENFMVLNFLCLHSGKTTPTNKP